MEEWKEQLNNGICTLEQLCQIINLLPKEKEDIQKVISENAFFISPYYANLIDKNNKDCPIRLQAIPSIKEITGTYGEKDPLMETNCSPIPLIIHVYPDRIAFLVSNSCAMYCRHCLRKYTVKTHCQNYSDEEINRAIKYISDTSSIRDVLLTGGDPLMLDDDKIEWIISSLRKISHVEIIRIGTRMICTLPSRITDDLCQMLKRYHPIWINTQFNHPKELTLEVAIAVNKLLEVGIPISNQSVLLKGINNSIETMKQLVQKLVYLRIRPYYIYQAQTLYGTTHFITPIEQGIDIINNLRGYTSGICEPKYVLDTPYGKVPLNPTYSLGRSGQYYVMKTYDDKIWKEYNPLY